MPHPVAPLVPHRVYGTSTSGNCHKVRMAFDALALPYRWHEIDIMKGESRTPQFLAMNPRGQVPLLQMNETSSRAESNPTLAYLAEGSGLWAVDRLARAQAVQWMFFEQYSNEP